MVRLTRKLMIVALLTVLVSLLVGIAIFLRGQRISFYTDGSTIRTPAAVAPVRDVLWQQPQQVLSNLTDNLLSAAVSPDGSMLVMALGSPGNDSNLHVCMSVGGKWAHPHPLEPLNSLADEISPAFAHDGRTLYFASNRAGGRGGFDLWSATLDEHGQWERPINLGPEINSPDDDYSPAIHPHDAMMLYFASNRSARITGDIVTSTSLGGYDLYRVSIAPPSVASVPRASVRVEPLHMLNTPHDETAPAFSPEGDFLYFASNRPGGQGGFDLWRARIAADAPATFQSPTNIAPPVNTHRDEIAAAVTAHGFGLLIVSNAADALTADEFTLRADIIPMYRLYFSASREVFTDWEVQRATFDWIAFWWWLWPWLIWIGLAVLIALLIYAMVRIVRGREGKPRAMGLLARCLLASMIAHVLLMLLFTTWMVATGLPGPFPNPGGRRVLLTTASVGTGGGIASQLNARIAEAPAIQPAELHSSRHDHRPFTEAATLLSAVQPDQLADVIETTRQQFVAAEALLEIESSLPAAKTSVDDLRVPTLAVTLVQEPAQHSADEPIPGLDRHAAVELSSARATGELHQHSTIDRGIEMTRLTPNPSDISSSDDWHATIMPDVSPRDALAVRAASPPSRPLFASDSESAPPVFQLPPNLRIATERDLEGEVAVAAVAVAVADGVPRYARQTNPAPESAVNASPVIAVDVPPSDDRQLAAAEPTVQSTISDARNRTTTPPTTQVSVSSSIERLAMALPESVEAPANTEDDASAKLSITTVAHMASRYEAAHQIVPTPQRSIAAAQIAPVAALPHPAASQVSIASELLLDAPVTSTVHAPSAASALTLSTSTRVDTAIPGQPETIDDSWFEQPTFTAAATRSISVEPHTAGDSESAHAITSILPPDQSAAPRDTRLLSNALLADTNPPAADRTRRVPPPATPTQLARSGIKLQLPTNIDPPPPGVPDKPQRVVPSHASVIPLIRAEAPGMASNTVPTASLPVQAVGVLRESHGQSPFRAFDVIPHGETRDEAPPLDAKSIIPKNSIIAMRIPQSHDDIHAADAVGDTYVLSSVPSTMHRVEPITERPVQRSSDLVELSPTPISFPEGRGGAFDPVPAHLVDASDSWGHRARPPSSQAPAVVARLAIELPVPLNPVEPPNPYEQRAPDIREQIVEKMGGSRETERSVAIALDWLARHQSPDGHWDGRSFDQQCNQCAGESRARVDIAITSLSLLCFLAADYTHTKQSPYQDHVQRALQWLLSQQKPDGNLMTRETMYSHGIASIALAEAFGMTGDPLLAEPARLAADFIFRARNTTVGGWRYAPGQVGDTSVMGWQVMALTSARRAGIEVPDEAFEVARHWLTLVSFDDAPGQYAYRPGREMSPAMTAEGMFVQQLLGEKRESRHFAGSARVLLDNLPTWDRIQSTYYWYYATLALFQHGGSEWDAWNEAVKNQLVANQHTRGKLAGSWDPDDVWAGVGGRVYQTAICTLSLQVYYRYLPLYLDETRRAAMAETSHRLTIDR